MRVLLFFFLGAAVTGVPLYLWARYLVKHWAFALDGWTSCVLAKRAAMEQTQEAVDGWKRSIALNERLVAKLEGRRVPANSN